ncbi:hypothetical protein BS47DRAFT_1077305 [Hydnum rufescens UP504]|uniref:Uncharacterized protein n=1 Tax=Hydnum rufescens UP504 TaxID=1448309 RepID=A0A9P6B8Z3_9AGAM|nr:hypothetical protein BS47DRAFT_1077305 [Hydnum rufescens UP504]
MASTIDVPPVLPPTSTSPQIPPQVLPPYLPPLPPLRRRQARLHQRRQRQPRHLLHPPLSRPVSQPSLSLFRPLLAPQALTTSSLAPTVGSSGFFSNTGAVAGTFTVVGLVGAGLFVAFVVLIVKRRRAKKFDQEIAGTYRCIQSCVIP